MEPYLSNSTAMILETDADEMKDVLAESNNEESPQNLGTSVSFSSTIE